MVCDERGARSYGITVLGGGVDAGEGGAGDGEGCQ